MASNSFLYKQLNGKQSKLATGAIITFVAVAVATSVWLQFYDSEFLRASVPVVTQKPEPPASDDSKIFQQPGIPFTFRYPASWELKRSSDAGVTFIDVTPIQMWVYTNLTDIEQLVAARALGINGEQLISWPGKLGTTSGTYWARVSVLNGTQAPYGARVFITKSGSSTGVVVLPEPPYTDAQQRLINSFSAR